MVGRRVISNHDYQHPEGTVYIVEEVTLNQGTFNEITNYFLHFFFSIFSTIVRIKNNNHF